MPLAYKRVLLKLSGEALMGDDAFGINRSTIESMVAEIAEVVRAGLELAIVIGGGNIFRGVALGSSGMDRATADYMGMLATMMNALALQDALMRADVDARVLSALRMDQVVEPYIRPKAMRHLEEGRVVDLRGRHRQPVLHHRHGRRAARRRDRRGDRAEGDEGRRRLQRRPEEGPDRHPLRGPSRSTRRSAAISR